MPCALYRHFDKDAWSRAFKTKPLRLASALTEHPTAGVGATMMLRRGGVVGPMHELCWHPHQTNGNPRIQRARPQEINVSHAERVMEAAE